LPETLLEVMFAFLRRLFSRKRPKGPLQCKNCLLYDAQRGACMVTVVHGGTDLELTVNPEDRCWWEVWGVEVNEIRATVTNGKRMLYLPGEPKNDLH
jgi:hypothetical protein